MIYEIGYISTIWYNIQADNTPSNRFNHLIDANIGWDIERSLCKKSLLQLVSKWDCTVTVKDTSEIDR